MAVGVAHKSDLHCSVIRFSDAHTDLILFLFYIDDIVPGKILLPPLCLCSALCLLAMLTSLMLCVLLVRFSSICVFQQSISVSCSSVRPARLTGFATICAVSRSPFAILRLHVVAHRTVPCFSHLWVLRVNPFFPRFGEGCMADRTAVLCGLHGCMT